MFVIGLTGNIATGKSTVMRILSELGAEIIDADRVAHELMLPGAPAYLKLISEFGKNIVSTDGTIDRKRLGAIVFSDPERLQRLDRIVHPFVVERIAAHLPQIDKPVVVIEAIKLIEAGLTTLCDEVWVVTSPREQQVKRLRETRGLTRSDALKRIAAQPPQEDKLKAGQVVIRNSGSLEELRRRVEDEWNRIQRPLPAPG